MIQDRDHFGEESKSCYLMVDYYGVLQNYGPKVVQFRRIVQVALIFGFGVWLLHQIRHPQEDRIIENLQNLFSKGSGSEFWGRKGNFGFLINGVLEFPDENAMADDEGSRQTRVLDDIVNADRVDMESTINATVEEAESGTKGNEAPEVVAEGGGSGGDRAGSDDGGFVFHDENGAPPDVNGSTTGVYSISDDKPSGLLREIE